LAQIFISHSARDTKALDFLNRAFATTNVQAKHEEIEALISGKRTSHQIALDIQFSNAIFVVLGPHVEELRHTRDWVVWESGAASGTNKDIWVLEAVEDAPRISIVIPRLRHYVQFDYNDSWLIYLRQIIASYDDSHVVKAMAAGAGLGGAISESMGGALVGGGIGLLLALNNAQTRLAGFPIMCPNCQSFYSVHIGLPVMRCPVCNTGLRFGQQPV